MKPSSLPDNEQQRLQALQQCDILDTPAEERFDRITRIAKHRFDVPVVLIGLIDHDRQWFKSSQGLDITEMSRDDSFCSHAIHSEEILLIPDTQKDSRFSDSPMVAGEPHVRFYAGAPIHAPGGERLGTLCLIDIKPRELSAQELNDLRDLANVVDAELERTSLHNNAKKLASSDARMHSIVDTVVDGIITINTIGEIQNFNKAAEDIFGYKTNEVIGKNIKMLMPDSFAKQHDGYLSNYLASGEKKIIGVGREVIGLRINGSTFPMELSVSEINTNGEKLFTGVVRDISERWNHEKTIQEHKERLRRAQIFANIGTWEWTIATGELYWSERIAPLFGYEDGEVETTYENFLAAVHEDDRQAIIDAVNNCVEHDAPYNIEHRVVRQDGSTRWLLERGAVIRDDDNNPMQMLGVVQDIDDRKRAELIIAESERQLLEAQSLSHIGSWKANLETGELNWSDEIYRIFGYQPGEIEPSVEAFHAAVHPDDLDKVRASEKHAEETGRHDVVHRIVLPDGSIRHVHELAQAQTSEAGKLLSLTGTVQDITDQVNAEARLHESEARFAFAVEGAGDGIWDWNITTGEMPLSGHYEEMLGFKKGEIKPDIDTWVASVHPDDLPGAQEYLQEYMQGKVDSYNIELRLRCKNGDYKWILCRGTIVKRDKDGAPLRMIGIHSDIDQRKHAEQALVNAREEAEHANQAKSVFLSNMSHELRTPLNAVLGFGQLLEYSQDVKGIDKKNVQEILKGGHHLLELINEVLDLAKVESGHIDLSLEPVEVSPIINDCIALVETQAAKRNINISQQDIENVMVRADRIRLKQALLNLLSNAIKYNREGGDVKLKTHAINEEQVRLSVSDTGAGIPDSQYDELFQPFNRLEAENSGIEGSGIGLTLTRRLVEMMGGDIGVTSEPGVGSTFWIDLPVEDSPKLHTPSSEDSSDYANNTDKETAAHEHTHTILYIEDNPANLKLVSQILGHRPHIHLITAHTPELGMELARTRKPELILLDINLPDMDGYQVLKTLRAEPDLVNTPIIAITASAMPEDVNRGIRAGFEEYISKPLDIVQFNNTLDRLLN